VAARMVNWLYYTYFGSGIICSNTRGVKLFLANVDDERNAFYVAGKKSKLDTLHKFWEWENRSYHKRRKIASCP
jgi:hypothetical protein